jgi:sugar phosphate isomerase/epimerase
MTAQISAEEGGSAMRERISFMSANYVGRELGYHVTTEDTAPLAALGEARAQCDRATNARFAPRETFGQCFEEILADVRDMGFQAIDVWEAHLNWRWATPEHVATAQDLLRRYDLPVTSLVSGGATREEFEATCQIARSLDTSVLQGPPTLMFRDRDFVVATLKRYGLKMGLHNPSEKSAQEILAKIGDGGGGVIGATVDTGFCAIHGYDAAEAIEELGEHVIHVHLKDVLAPGAHESCRYGQGCVPVERCVRALVDIGYQGYYCVEHEPLDFDPSDDCRANLAMLRQWLEG